MFQLSNVLASNKNKSRRQQPLHVPGWTIMEGTMQLKVNTEDYGKFVKYLTAKSVLSFSPY